MKFLLHVVLYCISLTLLSVCGLYYPPMSSSKWEETTVEELGWNTSAVEPLLQFLNVTNTKAFIVLKDGKIVLENYFDDFQSNDNWYWNSAGKVLTTALTGICQQEGHCKLQNKVSEYCGSGWTSAPSEKENLITLQHLLSMTSGLEENGISLDPEDLTYKHDAGEVWDYQNVFYKLIDVIVNATSTSGTVDRDDVLNMYNRYNDEKLKTKIGMNGRFLEDISGRIIYWSDARSMARYGILSLSKGRWNDEVIIDEQYFSESITQSQEMNQAYGYLWWLNGHDSYITPLSTSVDGPLVPSAPADAYFGMGHNTQRLHIVPSLGVVVVRLGNAWHEDDIGYAVSLYDDLLWKNHLNHLIVA